MTGIRRYLVGRQPIHHFHSELHRIPIHTFTHPPSSDRICLQKRCDPSGGPLWGGMRTLPKSMHLARAVAVCASRSGSHIKNTWTGEVSHSRSGLGRGCGFIGQRHGIHVRITRSDDVTPIPHLTLRNLLPGVICSIVLYTGAMYSTRVPVSHGLDWLDPEYKCCKKKQKKTGDTSKRTSANTI